MSTRWVCLPGGCVYQVLYDAYEVSHCVQLRSSALVLLNNTHSSGKRTSAPMDLTVLCRMIGMQANQVGHIVLCHHLHHTTLSCTHSTTPPSAVLTPPHHPQLYSLHHTTLSCTHSTTPPSAALTPPHHPQLYSLHHTTLSCTRSITLSTVAGVLPVSWFGGGWE